ncbi:iron uptake system protein EfeO [Microbacterium suwonense]|uniref:Lipoprotein n=1 Tax=Microbacterium suwonense TaxID=683047 RepID=A0ABN6X3I6_9MICO|nr:iron uptake system protein EfeO [Microbacterium suwonense]BDZ38583.1 lipoprotein [Microbacterium suwonense]
MTVLIRPLSAAAALAVTAFALTGCVAKAGADPSASFTVSSTADECTVSADTAQSGTLTFTVSNTGDQVSEFYLLADDGLRIIGEVENIAPAASRTLTVVAQPGDYFTVCKPGMIGEGVGRAAFTVRGDKVAIDGPDAEQKQQAVDLYAAFVKDQVGQLVPAVQELVTAYTDGDDERARELFATTRAYYERIEPVAEALGDLDPRIDYREVDAVAEGLDWTGFHRIEKDLWVPAEDALNADDETPAWQDWAPSTAEQRGEFGDLLIADVQELYDYVHSEDFTAALNDQGIAGISNGAVALLDEVATGKITGEEDWWSHTDLYDFAANVEGSKMAFSLVSEFVTAKGDEGAALVKDIAAGYSDLEQALGVHGSLDAGFVPFTDLNDTDKRNLIDLINALAEPLSQLTSVALS